MMAERYGFTGDQVGAMTLRQINVYLLSDSISPSEANSRQLTTDVQRAAFIASYKE